MSLDGGRKTEGVAEAIVRDVYFANQEAVEWGHLTSKETIHRFANISHAILFYS